MTKDEVWKEVVFSFEITNKCKLEVSGEGRVRSTTKVAEERLLKGAYINGYRCINVKLFKPRNDETVLRFQDYKNQLSQLNKKMLPLKTKIKLLRSHDTTYAEISRKLNRIQKLYDDINGKYRKEFNADLKKRTLNLTLLVHRLVAEYFCPKPSVNHSQVTHLDHNKLNNRSHNLRWMTQEELNIHLQTNPNTIAAKGANKGKQNEKSKHFKLTSTRVMLIKKRLNQGKSLSSLAKQFKVTTMQISRIKNGQNWSNIQAAS